MFKDELYKSNSNTYRIKIIDIASDKVKVLKLVDEDMKAAGTRNFKTEDLMNRIQDGEWELERESPEEDYGR
ncbi:hypothetical protein H7X64_05225 [Armatimonadetes bacterium]|nr:hypothetical protein [bacterium]